MELLKWHAIHDHENILFADENIFAAGGHFNK